MTAAGLPHLHILMATRNGAAHLDAQLTSIGGQSHTDWSLWVRDDGSSDGTRALLTAFAASRPAGQVHLDFATAPGAEGGGSAAGFLTLLADPARPEGPVAFADQDDVWLPHKCARALKALAAVPEDRPAAYASKTWLTGPDLQGREISVTHPSGPFFANALVQNILPGNTIVLNAAAARVMARVGVVPVLHHDWWVYLLMTAVGAEVICDDEPGLLYRQHASNTMGAHRGAGAAMERFGMLKNRVYSGWIDTHLAQMDKAMTDGRLTLPAPQRAMFEAFVALRKRPGGWERARALKALGIRRQSSLGTATLTALALTGRL